MSTQDLIAQNFITRSHKPTLDWVKFTANKYKGTPLGNFAADIYSQSKDGVHSNSLAQVNTLKQMVSNANLSNLHLRPPVAADRFNPEHGIMRHPLKFGHKGPQWKHDSKIMGRDEKINGVSTPIYENPYVLAGAAAVGLYFILRKK